MSFGFVPADHGEDRCCGTPVLYVLKRFPRLSETFILREILSMEGLGERILIDSLLPPEEGSRHRELDHLRADVRYLPRHPRLRHRDVLQAHRRLALRTPLRWSRLALRARRAGTWRRFLQAGLIADRARREEVRLIHAHFLTAAAEAARDAGILGRVPVTVTAHAKDIFQCDNVPLVRQRARGSSALVTVSEYNARYLRDLLGAEPKVYVVPNGVAVEPVGADRPEGPVLCIARLVPKKGIDVLIDAIALLEERWPEVRLEIIGGGPMEESLLRRAREAGVTGRVRFLGPRAFDEVEAAFRRCSMVVMASRVAEDGDRDGMPTVLTEALARGLPIVSTSVAGMSELVRHGETGLLVRPEDPAALAAAIDLLRTNRDLARQLGRAGRELVAERFDPTRTTGLLQDVFRKASA